MCARYDLNSPILRLVERFGLAIAPPPYAYGERRPTDVAPVVMPDRSVVALRWGLAVDWDRKPLINARAETLGSRATFRLLLGARLLVPADGYYEWRRAGDGPGGAHGAAKVKTRIAPPEGPARPFSMAGLWDARQGRFVIVTCAPAESVAHVHSRMPVILPDVDAEARWLDPRLPFPEVAGLLTPYRAPLVCTEPPAPPRPPSPPPKKKAAKPEQGDLFG